MSDLIDRQAAIDALKPCAGVGNRALDKLRALPSLWPRWISCSEKLPTDRDWCLGVFKEKSTGWVCIPFVCEYLGIETSATTHEGWTIHHCTDEPNKFGGDYFKELTCVAWMPLPEPWKGEDNEAD